MKISVHFVELPLPIANAPLLKEANVGREPVRMYFEFKFINIQNLNKNREGKGQRGNLSLRRARILFY